MISLLPTVAIDELQKQLEQFFINITQESEAVYELNALFRTAQPILLIALGEGPGSIKNDDTKYCHSIFEVMVNIIKKHGDLDKVIESLKGVNEGFDNDESISKT